MRLRCDGFSQWQRGFRFLWLHHAGFGGAKSVPLSASLGSRSCANALDIPDDAIKANAAIRTYCRMVHLPPHWAVYFRSKWTNAPPLWPFMFNFRWLDQKSVEKVVLGHRLPPCLGSSGLMLWRRHQPNLPSRSEAIRHLYTGSSTVVKSPASCATQEPRSGA
jgi:hypothetical protein